MSTDLIPEKSLYDRIYAVVLQIPPGKVASYGQIAQIVGGCSARMVGYAMAALKHRRNPDVPWQRVINRAGRISILDPIGGYVQRQLLEEEGVRFNEKDQVDFEEFGWIGPP